MDGQRAYITFDSDSTLRVTVHEGCALYMDGTPVPGMSWSFPLASDECDHLFGAQPDQPFADADRLLADHGWNRDGTWVMGGSTSGTYARVTRAH